jgi:cysteine desulfurase
MGIDLLSFSGHKLYGPKGIGALFVNYCYKDDIEPIMYGGGYNSGIRPGTLPVPLIVGLGKACEIASRVLIEENINIAQLRDSFENNLLEQIPNLRINGALRSRLSNNSNITFSNFDAEALLANMPDVVASTGSACEAGSIEPSRVLLSIGVSREQAYCTLRFGLGRFITHKELELATNQITTACEALGRAI